MKSIMKMFTSLACLLLYHLMAAMVIAQTAEGGDLMKISSSAFEEGGTIPQKYTCTGEDVSPPLSWSDAPKGAKSLVLICDDPDAPVGTWVHWVLYALPPTITKLEEGVPPEGEVLNGAKQGRNDFGNLGYGGPCPPPGKPHRYYFKLYAVDMKPELKPGATKAEVLKTIKGHILDESQLMGRFGRR